jgi:hypothetical protein
MVCSSRTLIVLKSTKNIPATQIELEEEMGDNDSEPKTELIAETENYLVWRAEEPDGETTYHMQLNNVTIHFFQEEWDELIELAQQLA